MRFVLLHLWKQYVGSFHLPMRDNEPPSGVLMLAEAGTV